MNVFRYESTGGKDLISKYLNSLPVGDKAEGYTILERLESEGLTALNYLNTRNLRNKLWEIKFNKYRMMYVIADKNNLYILHICKKQKNKAELFEIRKAIKRAKELEKEIGKKFI